MHPSSGEPWPTDPTRQRRPPFAPFVDERDNAERLTELCHRAYAEHAAQGRRFFGSYQSVEDTRRRVQDGECRVAVVAGKFVGTVTVSGPRGFPEGYPSTPQAGRFSQLAVDPTGRGTGLGRALLVHAERRLTSLGCDAVVVDTSSTADELLSWYARGATPPWGGGRGR